MQPHGLYSPWNSLGQNTGVGSLSLLQGGLPNPEIEPRSPTLQADSFFSKCFIIIILFYFTILYWFCHTSTCIRHGCTHVAHSKPPSHLPPHTIPLGHSSAPASPVSMHFYFSLKCTGEGNGNPLHCFCLENPRDKGAWWAAVYGVAQSRTRLKRLSSSSSSSSSSFCLLVSSLSNFRPDTRGRWWSLF